MKVAVDAMGGDLAPAAAVEGAVRASREFGIDVLLVGQEDAVRPLLAQAGPTPRIEFIHAPEVVGMDESPSVAIRKKRSSSLVVCAELVRDGRAQGMFSAGNTGAGMAAGLFTLGRIPGIKNPALAIILPTTKGIAVLLDAGANVDVGPHALVQFGVMGTIYAREMFGIESPRVGLVNIGEEDTKGNELTREAHQLLRKAAGIQFVGNVEGRDLFGDIADVAVCDGFTGNVVLKTSEGVADLVMNLIRQEVDRDARIKVGAALMKPAFRRIRQRTDYRERGGAPLLGVNGVCLIGHGRSNSIAVANAIRTAGDAIRHGLVEKIRAQIAAGTEG